MSSPSTFFEDHGVAPVHIDGSPTRNIETPQSRLPERLMRVKVLYTFDHQNNTNCLARLPHPAKIPTFSLDETTQIGFIKLRTCIQAIISASPEVVAKLGQDYTVYAYDYSEYGTPLVSQGMLSWMLAPPSSTPQAAEQQRTNVTGRICENILGIFSNGIKETLEVKLRLVPVPIRTRSDYLASVQRGRSDSKTSFEGSHRQYLPPGSNAGSSYGADDGQDQDARQQSQSGVTGGIEGIQGLLAQRAVSDEHYTHYPSPDEINFPLARRQSGEDLFASMSGAPSPASSMESFAAAHNPGQNGHERALSRGHIQRDTPTLTHTPPFEGQDACDQDAYAAHPRKRARLSQAHWRGKSVFETKAEPLRVTASTAASIRVHRPVPNYPAQATGHSSDVASRPPTPRPSELNQVQLRGRSVGQSGLRQESNASDKIYVSPYSASQDLPTRPQSAQDLPNGQYHGSPEGDPTDLPSSPPIIAPRSYSLGPPSPALSARAAHADSGFMSGTADRDENEEPQVTFHDIPGPKRSKKQRLQPPTDGFLEETPGPPELLPTKILPRNAKYRPPRIHSDQAASSTQTGKEKPDSRQARDTCKQSPLVQTPSASVETAPLPVQSNGPVSSLTFPKVPARPTESSEPGAWPQQQVSVKETLKEPISDRSTEPASDASDLKSVKNRSGSGAKRKKAIEKRLADSVAEGTMPPFCMNCGAIETTTWRRAVSKIMDGSPNDIQLSEEILTCEILTRGEQGEVTKYRLIAKYVGSEERPGFKSLLFCNPCGLYLNKMKCMRPQEMWLKTTEPALKRRGPYKKKKGKLNEQEPSSDFMPASETGQLAPDRDPGFAAGGEPPCGPTESRPRSSSLQPDRRAPENNTTVDGPAAAASLGRAIQSSPVRFLGTKGSPIELDEDLTPKPTRRLLFPSPRREGEMKSLSEPASSTEDKSSRIAGEAIASNNDGVDPDDKENCPPATDDADEFADLFEDDGPMLFQTTPSKPGTRLDLNKSPFSSPSLRKSISPQAMWSSRKRRHSADPVTPSRVSRSAKPAPQMTPITAELHQLLSEGNDLISPSKAFDFAPLAPLNSADDNLHTFIMPGLDDDALPMPLSPPDNLFSLYVDPVESPGELLDHTSVAGSPSGCTFGTRPAREERETAAPEPATQEGTTTDLEIVDPDEEEHVGLGMNGLATVSASESW